MRSPPPAPRRSCSPAGRSKTLTLSPPLTSTAWRWSSRAAGTSGTDMAAEVPSTDSRGLVAAILLLLALPVFFIFLGANSIWDANEAFYVETPRQMVHTGDYITPTFNGQKRLNKPVLSYWIVAGLYRTFGESVT